MLPPRASVRAAGEGETYAAGPFAIVNRVTAEQTGGAFEFYELGLGVATVDYHIHRTMDETIHVLEGQIEFTVAGQTYSRSAGATTFVPRGVHHGFANRGPGRARVLLLFSPATNQATYFRGLEKLFSAAVLDKAALVALQKQFDQDLVPLP